MESNRGEFVPEPADGQVLNFQPTSLAGVGGGHLLTDDIQPAAAATFRTAGPMRRQQAFGWLN
jgi:hypothetical protein